MYAGACQSGQFKSVTLELGGKNPIVIYPDVDPATAAAAIIKGTNFAASAARLWRDEPALLQESARRGAQRVVADTAAIKLDPRRPGHGDGLHGLPPIATGCCR